MPSPSTAAPIELTVSYKRLNSFFADYAKNIRRGHTFIATDAVLEVGTRFVFKLQVPTVAHTLALSGIVHSVIRPELDPKGAGMEISFEFSSEAERVALDAAVEAVMTQSLGATLCAGLLKRPVGSAAPSAAR